MKILFSTSPGGHLSQTLKLAKEFIIEDRKNLLILIINSHTEIEDDVFSEIIRVPMKKRGIGFFTYWLSSLCQIKNYKPDVIVSFGAGNGAITCIVGRFLGVKKIYFIESFSRVNTMSLSGKILQMLNFVIYVQHESVRGWLGKKNLKYVKTFKIK